MSAFHYMRPAGEVNRLHSEAPSAILGGMRKNTEQIEYTLIRSARRSIGLELTPEGELIVRAPRFATKAQIEALLWEKADWIARARARAAARAAAAEAAGALTPEELKALAAQAKAVLPGRVAHFAALLGVDYGRITIRAQRTRWGSCSSQGNLNFNCLLMLTPPAVIDSVVAHELCHRRHMDHSPAFYAELFHVCPDYRECRAWLKEHGPVLLARAQAE